MKTILYIVSLAGVLAVTGCVVPVHERTYVQRREYSYPHHWEHKGIPERHYYYYDRY
jgi:hypothetical protein